MEGYDDEVEVEDCEIVADAVVVLDEEFRDKDDGRWRSESR